MGRYSPLVDGRGDARSRQGRDRSALTPASWSRRAGAGNFLVRVLQRKLAAVELKYGKSDFERRHYALLRTDVHLRYRTAGGQHRRVPREHAGNPRRLPERRGVGRPVPGCLMRALAESRAWRRADDALATASRSPLPNGATSARASSSGATSASTSSPAFVGLQRGGWSLRPTRQA
jgi:hypothetical protein